MSRSTTQQPNLVYVFADQLRYQSCGYAGDTRAHTPNIDQFATEGANFCNAVSGSPMCAPYRASLFTGKYASSTGMAINELRMNPNHDCFGSCPASQRLPDELHREMASVGESIRKAQRSSEFLHPSRATSARF